MTSSPPRAPAIADKLEAARAVRASLDPEIAQAALEAAEGVRGAEKRLADLRARIATADRDVSEAALAHDLALQLDRRAGVTARAKMRQDQLATFADRAKARDEMVAEMCGLIEKLARTYDRYVNATALMVGVVPIGTHLPVMNLGSNGILGSAIGKLDRLLAAEAFRNINLSSPIAAMLPFAQAPSLMLSKNPRAVVSGADAFREATAAILEEIQAQIAKLDAEDAAALGTKEIAA